MGHPTHMDAELYAFEPRSGRGAGVLSGSVAWYSFGEIFPAHNLAPALARRRLHAWLDAVHWPTDSRDDVVLAASEAVSNAAEHAYSPGRERDITVHAALVVGPSNIERVIVSVADSGRWREPPVEHHAQRRGLQIMRAVTDELRLEMTSVGTRIKMISRPIRQPR
jgi:anti-sigma regulatory factor (Ser/Thr protein kinase)